MTPLHNNKSSGKKIFKKFRQDPDTGKDCRLLVDPVLDSTQFKKRTNENFH
jgi:hypothetical protein